MINKNSRKLAILTLNTYGIPIIESGRIRRHRYIGRSLNHVDLDILNFQEIMTYDSLLAFRHELKAFPFICFEVGPLGPKGGLVTFSKYPLEKIEFSQYTKEGTISSSILSKLNPKGMLSMKITQMSIVIINTHLSSNRDNDWSRGNRFFKMHQAQLRQLRDYIYSIVGTENFGLVTGDFNISKHSELYEDFISESGINDIFADIDTPTFHHEFLPEGRNSNRIDYILAFANSIPFEIVSRDEVFREKTQIDSHDEYLSDHVGLSTELELKK